MSDWCVSGQGNTVLVEFKKDGEFVIPDPGSIKLTIRSNSGLVVGGYDKQAQVGVLSSTWLLAVPGAVNITNEEREARYIIVDFTSGNYPCSFRVSYRLTAFLPIQVLPQDVRTLLGLREEELKDFEVEIYDAYFALLRSNPALGANLVTGNDATMYANKAIALKAALLVMPSVPLRAAKQDSLNNATLLRATIDYGKLQAELEGQLSDALANMGSVTAISYAATPLLLLTTPVDPITNA